MRRLLPVLAAVAAVGLGLAAPATAEPCGNSMDSVEYALEVATGEPPAAYTSANCVLCACDACYPSACQCDVYCYCVKHSSDLVWCLRELNNMWCPGEPNPLG